MNKEGKTEIRKYLLGRVTDTSKLENIEEQMFSDEEFCSQVEIGEEELVHDFVFGKLNRRDRQAFEEKIANNSEMRFKTEMANALKEKAQKENIVETAPGFSASLIAFFRRPAYAGAFAVLVIGILALSFFLLLGRRDSPEMAELKRIYQKERPVEALISDFDYAPLSVTRGEVTDEALKDRLTLMELKFRDAVKNDPTAENYHELGAFLLTQRNFDEAIKKLDKAVELNDKNASYHNDLGSAYFAKDHSFESLTRANNEFARACELNPDLLAALFNRSLALQELGLIREAKESWNSYLQKDPSSKPADEARQKLAELENRPVSEKKKEQVLQDFLNAYRGKDEKDEKMVWKIHTETKGLFNDTSLVKQLPQVYLEARARHDAEGAREALEALTHIGELEKEKNDDHFFAGLASFYAKVDDAKIEKLTEAKALLTEGNKLFKQAKGTQAIEQVEKGKKIFLQMNAPGEAYAAELELNSFLPDIGQNDECVRRLDSLIGTAEKLKFKVLLPTAYYHKSRAEWRRNQSSRAVKNADEALQIAGKISDIYQVKESQVNLARIHEKLGESGKFLDYLNKALDNKDLYYVNNGMMNRLLLTSSDVSADLGFDLSAADFATESLGLSKEFLGKTDLVNYSMKNLTKALASKKQFDKALAIADESNRNAMSADPGNENEKTIADTFLWRADLKRQMEKCGEALPDYERSLEHYGKTPQTTFNLYSVHKGKLLCYDALKLQNEFGNELDTVLQLSEEHRRNITEDASRQAFFENEQVVFDTAIDNALRQKDNQKAFDLLEKSKARSLLDFVRSTKSVAELEKEFGSVSQPLTLAEIQARLTENVQVIQYSVLPKKLAIWRVTRDRFELTEKAITSDELEKKVLDYKKAVLEKGSLESLKPAAQELYKLLLPANIEGEKTICLIPDKFLHQLPFDSLVSPANRSLIEDFPIFSSPSASILVLASENARQKEAAGERLLGIGNPNFDREENPKLAALPQAETEVQAIAKDYPESQIFTGDKATKKGFLDNFENAEIVHFAGHFVAIERSPGYSRLLFAGGDLRSFELAEKRLPKVKLVILSACQTGFEHYNKSEGAIGIARTFLATGAPLVLASGWKVDSEATKDLMIAFHRNRKQKGLAGAESLRRAQLELMKNEKTSAPYYWSAFNLVGGVTAY